MISIDSILTILNKTVDILLVWLIFYYILKVIKDNVKLTLIFKGVIFIVILELVSHIFQFTTIGMLLEYIIMWGPLALIIIFQPEIRSALEQLGRSQLLGRHKILTVDEREKMVYEIVNALDQMRKARIGALLVIERDVSLSDYIAKAKKVYADITTDLIVSLFFPNNPLHDGGVIIQGDKISCAGAVFPTSNNLKNNKHLGTRHRAGLGISEETDAIVLIVSEETGRLTICLKGEMFYNLSLDDVRMTLIDELRPKQETDFEEISEEEIYEENK